MAGFYLLLGDVLLGNGVPWQYLLDADSTGHRWDSTTSTIAYSTARRARPPTFIEYLRHESFILATLAI
jgi:hypothetical protein